MCVPVSARKVHDVGAVVKQAADQLVVRTEKQHMLLSRKPA